MSQKASGYERVEGDRYFTPAWPVEALVSIEQFRGFTIDPCAGGWHIVDTLKAAGIDAAGFDIEPPPLLEDTPGGLPARRDEDVIFYGQDFLAWQGTLISNYRGYHHAMNIVSNPPYGQGGRLAVEFIAHALELTERLGGKVAMLLRVDFDSAKTRSHIFGDHPAFAAKYTLTQRIRWANLPQSSAGPTENHAWFVWDWQKRRDTSRAYGYLPLTSEK